MDASVHHVTEANLQAREAEGHRWIALEITTAGGSKHEITLHADKDSTILFTFGAS